MFFESYTSSATSSLIIRKDNRQTCVLFIKQKQIQNQSEIFYMQSLNTNCELFGAYLNKNHFKIRNESNSSIHPN